MWLVYPVTPDDVRDTRRGVAALLVGSAVWYGALAAVLAVWADDVLIKVRNKFDTYPFMETNWIPFLILLAALVAAGGLRLLGYRLCRNVAGAVGSGDGLFHALIGGAIWTAAFLMLYFGFSGLLALVMAVGTAFEMKFLRFPGQLFGMVVSPIAVRRLSWFFYARTAWLAAVVAAALVLLIAHILVDIPRNPGGPYEATVSRVNGVLKVVFNGFAVFAIVLLPAITFGYWAILRGIYQNVDKLLDPNGPAVMPEAPEREGHDLLKQVLQPPEW